MYLVREGNLRIYRNIAIKVPGTKEQIIKQVPLNEICEGNFVGEEIFFGKGLYENTIKVFSSSCRLLVFTINMTSTDFSNTFVAKSVTESYKIKSRRRNEYLDQIIQNNPEQLLATENVKEKTRTVVDDIKDHILGMIMLTKKTKLAKQYLRN
jgi:hypothetical protein